MLFLMFACIVFLFAFMQGIHVGIVGTLIGVVVGAVAACGFYFSLRFVGGRWFLRLETWTPETFHPPQNEPFRSKLAGGILWFASLAWFIICSAFSAWLTDFLIRCSQSGGRH
jgi:hypothetical protein